MDGEKIETGSEAFPSGLDNDDSEGSHSYSCLTTLKEEDKKADIVSKTLLPETDVKNEENSNEPESCSTQKVSVNDTNILGLENFPLMLNKNVLADKRYRSIIKKNSAEHCKEISEDEIALQVLSERSSTPYTPYLSCNETQNDLNISQHVSPVKKTSQNLSITHFLSNLNGAVKKPYEMSEEGTLKKEIRYNKMVLERIREDMLAKKFEGFQCNTNIVYCDDLELEARLRKMNILNNKINDCRSVNREKIDTNRRIGSGRLSRECTNFSGGTWDFDKGSENRNINSYQSVHNCFKTKQSDFSSKSKFKYGTKLLDPIQDDASSEMHKANSVVKQFLVNVAQTTAPVVGKDYPIYSPNETTFSKRITGFTDKSSFPHNLSLGIKNSKSCGYLQENNRCRSVDLGATTNSAIGATQMLTVDKLEANWKNKQSFNNIRQANQFNDTFKYNKGEFNKTMSNKPLFTKNKNEPILGNNAFQLFTQELQSQEKQKSYLLKLQHQQQEAALIASLHMKSVLRRPECQLILQNLIKGEISKHGLLVQLANPNLTQRDRESITAVLTFTSESQPLQILPNNAFLNLLRQLTVRNADYPNAVPNVEFPINSNANNIFLKEKLQKSNFDLFSKQILCNENKADSSWMPFQNFALAKTLSGKY